MTNDEVKKIIEKHKKWLKCQETGERADLRGADLCNADLRNADLRNADLRDANLRGADLRDADLSDADLRNTNMRCADMCDADLRGADLCNADLRNADLRGTDLFGAKDVPFVPMTCPDSGSFTAWKKAHGYIVKLFIPEDARRSSATGRKCRCDKAVVVAIETISGEPSGMDEIESEYDGTFIYKVGETVAEPNYCVDRFIECAKGIHFFISRQEAVDYII